MTSIKFGTDGWRALIDTDFTEENITAVIQAFCDWRSKLDPSQKKVIIGFDRRRRSPETAQLVARVLASNGFLALLASQYCPTPCVSWMVKSTDAFSGIMVTASHNPASWNGIKFKESYGGSASPEYTAEIEKQCHLNLQEKKQLNIMSYEEAHSKNLIQTFNPHDDYINELRSLIDIETINKSKIKIISDPLFGAGTNYFSLALGIDIHQLHSEADTNFGGINPEPIDKNLDQLMQTIKKEKFDIGLATDGDADRIGAVDENGTFVSSHQIFALLLKHYVEDRGLKGIIVKSLSTTQMINRLCERYQLKLIETPIGFKYICQELLENNALMGGEESGGISFAPHVHERDGVLNGLMLLEMMAQRKKSLRQLLNELFSEVGTFYYDRVDLHIEGFNPEKLQAKLLPLKLTNVANIKIENTLTVDGVKYQFIDGSWLLLRASGTEPLVRIYAESATKGVIEKLLLEGQNLLK